MAAEREQHFFVKTGFLKIKPVFSLCISI